MRAGKHPAGPLVAVVIALAALPLISRAGVTDFTIPEAKLLDSEFADARFGPAVLSERFDVPGPAVGFTFTGLGEAGTGVKDDYPVDTVYGQNLPSHGNGDFSNFAGYALRIENIDSDAVWLSLFLNTGFTGPSGNPPNNPANDTFWQSPWMELPAGETTVLRLDFDDAIPWNIEDNPPPHTQGNEGEPIPINDYDRTEVSAIGFQIAVFDLNPDATVLISPIIAGDLNGDGCVDQSDLGIVLADWDCTGGDCPGDCDDDGDTDQSDLGILLAHWGEGCE